MHHISTSCITCNQKAYIPRIITPCISCNNKSGMPRIIASCSIHNGRPDMPQVRGQPFLTDKYRKTSKETHTCPPSPELLTSWLLFSLLCLLPGLHKVEVVRSNRRVSTASFVEFIYEGNAAFACKRSGKCWLGCKPWRFSYVMIYSSLLTVSHTPVTLQHIGTVVIQIPSTSSPVRAVGTTAARAPSPFLPASMQTAMPSTHNTCHGSIVYHIIHTMEASCTT